MQSHAIEPQETRDDRRSRARLCLVKDAARAGARLFIAATWVQGRCRYADFCVLMQYLEDFSASGADTIKRK